jgi:hypothetical protein
MKPFSSLLKNGLRLFVFPLGLLLGQTLAAAVSFTVTPSAISNQYAGMITLAITGLTNGEPVAIDKFLDANTNGVIDGGDLLQQRFPLTDGQVSLIGGATNVNVPGDSNPAASNITALLNFESIDLEHIVGSYLFKVSSPTARFTPVTNAFNVTNSAYLQSFTGQVRSNGTATAVANAVVILLNAGQQGKDFGGGVVADNSGNYRIKAAPGTYLVFATKSNFVADLAAPPLTLGAGLTVTTNLNLLPTTRTISGKVADASNNAGIPGVFIVCQSTNNLLAISFTDANGNFNVPVTASSWEVGVNDSDAALHGYVRLRNSPNVITTTGSVAGVNILLPKGTAMFYGSIKDDLGNPLAGFDVYDDDQDTHEYESDGVSDASGNYTAAALAGNWYADLSNDDPRLANYVYSGNIGTTTLTNGQAVRQDFVLKPATNHIAGYVKDNGNNPIAGVGLYAYATINGTSFNSGYTVTDGNGNYSLNVANGTWQIGVNCGCSDCDDSLSAKGYQCVPNQQVTISGNNGVANFIAQPCGPLQVTTTSLPDATVGTFYNVSLQASGCAGPFNWSLSPGSAPLPPGMSVDVSGGLFGNPTTNGTFNFSVRVTDNNSATADQPLSLIVTLLQVTTTNLPSGTQGVFYSTQLNASGGVQPYDWSLSPGSNPLPSGLSLGSDGTLDGMPNAAGVFNFSVRVTDVNRQSVADRLFSLTINSGSPPLQVTTTNLANGTSGVFYSQQLQATGGQAPYSWYLPGGSITLPPGMNLSTSGVLSGTPGATGVFNFQVAVYVNNPYQAATQGLSLTINAAPSPLQVTTTSLANGTLNTFYSQLVNASGGQQPYTWSLAPGSMPLPPGLNLSSGGTISGTPTNSGTFFFNLRVTDALSATADGLLSIYIPTPPLQITTASLTNAQQGASYSNQLQASGGQMPYSWSLAPGSLGLPPNLSLSTGGDISGLAATNGTFFFIVRVTDGTFAFTNRSLSLTLNPKPTLAAVNRTGNQFQLRLNGATGQNYTVQFSTNLVNPNWLSLLITNPSAASVTILDPNATNSSRFYRAWVGP